ncbi:hypothetical protein BX600DRAFT_474856 [Xylariales sp. PMI_506]|nr:hypothetical protein BX600DRAFT_474856 [Xylariales sp. PMI_506]
MISSILNLKPKPTRMSQDSDVNLLPDDLESLIQGYSPFATWDSQLTCPLLTQIPPEIRKIIWELSLTEYDVPGGRYIPEIGEDDLVDVPRSVEQGVATEDREPLLKPPQTIPVWFRPGSTTKQSITTELLRTCKRVYLETHYLPPLVKKHQGYINRGPGPKPIYYFSRMAPEQRRLVRELQLFTQQFAMEESENPYGRHFEAVAPYLHELTITLRQSDWWNNEWDARLVINPFSYKRGEEDQAIRRGETLPMRGWGAEFTQLSSLKRLIIEFEHHEGKEEELKAIIARATSTWVFPWWNGGTLVPRSDVTTSTWLRPVKLEHQMPPAKRPRMIIMTVVWEPRAASSTSHEKEL